MGIEVLAIVPILSLLMLVHELGHFITARRAGIVVQEFGFGLPPRLIGIERGGVVYSLNLIPFGAFVRMLGEEDPSQPGSFASKSRLTRAIVLASGAGMNFALAVLAFALAFMTGVPSEVGVSIARVAPGSPAEAAGFQPGDRVLRVDGQPMASSREFSLAVRDRLGQPIAVTVQRDGVERTLAVTPRTTWPEGQGPLGVELRPILELRARPPHVALWEGFVQSVRYVLLVLQIPVLLLQGTIAPEAARPIGLPGMAQIAGQAAEFSTDTGYLYPVLFIIGGFSAGLAVANLLPIPALDGGRLLFVLIEAVRGRRVSPEREGVVHFVGLVVLLTLMLLIAINDILAPLPPINWGFR